jgi:hypothetical protein
LKSDPCEESHGKLHPIRFLKRSIFSIGARETTAKAVSRAARCARLPAKLSATIEHAGHPSSSSGPNMKW